MLTTLRVAPGDLGKLAEGVAYTLVAGALAFLLATARLRARRSA
ncbi:MAG TPA: hypothetical protein VHB47_20740 [Thermoanaerobaculia bacterium]|nr:hypothetical protein [Thermoanaerobaculia bacterium]